MAKKKTAIWWEKKHNADVLAYQKKVNAEYKKAIQKIVTKMPLLPKELGDEPLSLDKYPVAAEQIDAIIAELSDNVKAICTNGIREQWALAKDKNDGIVPVLDDKGEISQIRRQINSIRSDEALSAFLDRKQAGLTISDRVWKYSDQYRTEIESGLEMCIRDGKSAASAAAQMKQYLVYPDKLFRRVRDEHGVLQLSKAAKAFHPGRGVYRSSYKNARRLVATETNVAYRLSDYQRWQEEDEVVGIEIKLSNNHTINGVPFTDMCDDLKGKYPKDFVFTGWHPLCRCYAVPILKTREERVEDIRRIARGEEPSTKSVNAVRDVPGAYKTYIAKNTARIESMKGLPDWVAYNEKYVPQLTLNEMQAKRLQDVSAIFHKVSKPTTLDLANIRHQAGTPEQIARIKDTWHEHQGIIDQGNAILGELQGIQGVDTAKMEGLLKHPNWAAIKAETKALEGIKQEILSLKWIDDPMSVAKTYGLADTKAVSGAIDKTIGDWVTKYNYKSWEAAPLAHKKGKLEREITSVGNTSYKTAGVAKDAYAKMLVEVDDKLDWEMISQQKAALAPFAAKTKAKAFTTLWDEFEDAIAAGNKAKAKALVPKLDAEKLAIEKKNLQSKLSKAKKKSKNTAGAATSASTSDTEIVLGNINEQKMHQDALREGVIATIKALTQVDDVVAAELRDAVSGFTYQWDYEIRAYQTGASFSPRHGHKMADIIKKAENCEKYIELAPKWKGGITYRGMSLSDKEVEQMVKDLKAGTCDMKGVASWSTDQHVSRSFSQMHTGEASPEFGDIKNTNVVLWSRTQEKATSIRYLSNFRSEDEVLCSVISRYKYVGQEVREGYLYIEVEPVLHNVK